MRFHPRLSLNGQFTPAMVVLFRDIRTNEPKAIQRTFFDAQGQPIRDERGRKVRKMLASVVDAAIKITPHEEVEQGLHIGEGFETCLAARNTGLRPVWALGSAGAIERFPVLPGIDALTILAERDVSGTGERAAYACAERWTAASRDAFIAMPAIGVDLADAWEARR